ncbi:MAG: D-alanyl-D-alanine carboxypeptidase [Alsobacter sp.]
MNLGWSVRGRAVARARALASMAVVASVVVASVSTPAEARRRHHHSSGGGYNPPYAAMVVDAKTGRTLYAQNEDALRHPASVTKVMTLYLLFEQLERGKLRLDSELTISAHAARQAPSKLGLDPGETIEVEDAIKAVVTKSANDIAVAIAENIAGSESAFAEQMTRKARQIGMSRTTYVNASGLPDTRQVTTARDLVTLGRAIQDRFPKYYAYFSTHSFAYNGAVHRNHNRLLGRVEGMDGIKTGYTRMSGFNLLTSVRTDNRHVVAVVLGGRSAASRDRQMADLIDTYTDRAYAGSRTAPPVGESAKVAAEDAEAPVQKVAAEKAEKPGKPQKLALAEEDTTTTTAAVAPAPKPGAKVIDLTAARPVVASVAGGSSTTPSSTMRWTVGAQPARTGGTETKVAKADVKDVKSDAKAETKVEKAAALPKSAQSGWVIQLGATDDEAKAREILQRAKARSQKALSKADAFTEKVNKGGSTLYRARFSGFDEDDAQTACKSLKRDGFSCFAVKGG